MVTTKRSEPPTYHIHSEGYNTKHVDSFKYLGHLLPMNGKCLHDVKRKITVAKDIFCEMKEVTKIRTSPPKIWNIILHGCKTWEVVKEAERRINVAEMFSFKRI